MNGKFQRPELAKMGDTKRQLTTNSKNEIPKPWKHGKTKGLFTHQILKSDFAVRCDFDKNTPAHILIIFYRMSKMLQSIAFLKFNRFLSLKLWCWMGWAGLFLSEIALDCKLGLWNWMIR